MTGDCSLKTPVLFIVFNRPDVTQRVFARIRDVRPEKLFVAADGPRADRPDDELKCEAVRSLIKVDWDCELHTLYSDKNLGCGLGPSSAINWFFEHVEQGIILEDDCLASPTFFRFCGEILDHFESCEEVFAISGTNILGVHESDYSFVFSYYGGNWGWATWKRAWLSFDYEMQKWNDQIIKKRIRDLLLDDLQFSGVEALFNHRLPSAWDTQWFFTRLAYGGLSIVPTRNLVANIGFGNDATHTFDRASRFYRLPVFDLEFPLKIDGNVMVNRDFDRLNAKAYGYFGPEPVFTRAARRILSFLK